MAVEAAKEKPLGDPKGGAPKGNQHAAKSENNRDNITVVSPRGTSAEYTLRRLARDGHTDLLDQIANGEISTNKAAKRETNMTI